MFHDKRSRRIVIVAHCLLNQNSISDGTADLPSQFTEVIDLIMTRRIGVIQLPCPELTCLGLDRQDRRGGTRELLTENSRIRRLMMRAAHRRTLQQEARRLAMQIEQYVRYDFAVVGIVGINRSPSCGIETTTVDGHEVPGRGVFMEIIERELRRRKIDLRMIGVKTSRKRASLREVKALLG